MRKLSTEKRVMILSALVEGNSINATCRMTGASKVTVLRLLADAGTFCAQYHNVFVRELKSKRVQLDEIWSFCGCKDKAKQQGADGHGSDGYKPYLAAVDAAFAGAVDYAMLIKVYGAGDDDHRYSPATCTGCKTEVQSGSPDPEFINTSYVERQNLTLRMSQRRFTRLTNAFSKKIENHEHAVALHYFHYNFIRKHQTLKTTPAVAAGIASKSLTVLDLVTMIEAEEAKLGERLTSYLPSPKSK